ncbi:hypothetical protein ASPFODRAFT_141075 [Aspergillus luchuensis CBS 106.47]|uniref:Beta-lactamase-related domain-containing protein n=1 Tax=Aspergillus luchuensis (strain CBS 106.47) TaxID=1137211 RepID=A0A1M3T8K9_ASPLC|nr:hypothetical protein ASPFODRAFT_141075 [Aspergillus luchuensis CBS 106.47]
MSTEPLLPSYASATQHDASPHVRRHSARRRTSLVIPAAPVIQTLSGLTFMTTAIISTVWAYRSYVPPPELSPAEPPSLLPYFASLCLTISLGFWVGYLLFILYDGAGGPRMQRKVVIGASTVGKLVLAGAHIGVWLGYKYLLTGSKQPSWALMFLATQACHAGLGKGAVRPEPAVSQTGARYPSGPSLKEQALDLNNYLYGYCFADSKLRVTCLNMQAILEAVPSRYRGPGGAVAIIKDGELAGKYTWGYADLRKRIPMTASTLMPICSITKQMLCLILKDLERNPTPAMVERGDIPQQLSDAFRQLVSPELIDNNGLRIDHLCNNQSGIRDYWAMSMFWGTQPEGGFTLAEDAKKALDRTKSLHFQPGTQFSYCNLNFHILARIVEHVSGTSLGELLSERLFLPAGMKTATLCADNAELPLPCVGYEGNESFGYIPAVNRTQWSGDAGVVASLEDMIAYECYLDKAWADRESVYREIAKEPLFDDGTPAGYGYGLEHIKYGQTATIGHGGAIRGYRLHRTQAPTERVAVVAMLNHEIDAAEVAGHILQQALSLPTQHGLPSMPAPNWAGIYFDPEAQLVVEVRLGGPGEVIVTYTGDDETLKLTEEFEAQSDLATATLCSEILILHRKYDNRHIQAKRIIAGQQAPKGDYVGRYHCTEMDSIFLCSGAGGMLYGSFKGFLGHGPAELMRYLGDDIWFLVCARGLDAPAPGNWTVVFQRDVQGEVVGVTFGCWLARKITFVKDRTP